MTQRLPLYLSASLLAHMAVLLAWHAAPLAPPNPAEPGLQVSLVHTVQRVTANIAAAVPAPHAPLKQHTTRSARPSAQTRHGRRPHHTTVTMTTPPVVAATATNDTAGMPTVQTHAPNLTADTDAHIQNALRIAFNSYFSYPAIALRHGWAGVVKLSLRLEPDGHLSDIRLIQSSGHSALDAAALATAQRIPPLHEAVTWLRGNSHVILLPVEYRLIDG